MKTPPYPLAALIGAALLLGGCASAPTAPTASNMTAKPATSTTERANASVRQAVAAFDKRDFDDATRGKLAALNDPLVKAADGRTVWDTRSFDFLKGDAPASANPSLWRMQQLNHAQGLFKVADGIYQIRGYDLANMTLVEGNTGWIVIDTLLTPEMARVGLKLAMDTLKSSKPVVAVIYTHSHVDHFGGVRGVVDEADVRSGKVKLIAPDAFMEYAIAENVLAGNAMSRRAQFMYGVGLPASDKGTLGTGLGLGLSSSVPGLIPPSQYIKKTGEEMTIDGVRIQFQMAKGSEAPSEFMFYFPDKKALCLSEVATKLMHNIYTIRGAQVRDALGWSKYINETMDLFPDAEVAFASHHWPTWGKDNIRGFLANQRDTYRFLHDRALHLANQGLVMDELGSDTFVPKALATDAASRGYYGTLSQPACGLQLLPRLLRRQPGHAAPAAAGGRCPPLRRRDGRRGGGAGHRPQGLPTATTGGWPRWSTTWSSPTRPMLRRARCRPTRWSNWATRPNRRRGATPTCWVRRSCALARSPRYSAPAARTPCAA